MKHVPATHILGNPNRADRQHACPDCQERAMVFDDGSVMCILEGKCFEPDPTNPHDAELVAMRKAYDERNGITPSQRLLIPAQLDQELHEAGDDRR